MSGFNFYNGSEYDSFFGIFTAQHRQNCPSDGLNETGRGILWRSQKLASVQAVFLCFIEY